jgi:hypothetical protein
MPAKGSGRLPIRLSFIKLHSKRHDTVWLLPEPWWSCFSEKNKSESKPVDLDTAYNSTTGCAGIDIHPFVLWGSWKAVPS